MGHNFGRYIVMVSCILLSSCATNTVIRGPLGENTIPNSLIECCDSRSRASCEGVGKYNGIGCSTLARIYQNVGDKDSFLKYIRKACIDQNYDCDEYVKSLIEIDNIDQKMRDFDYLSNKSTLGGWVNGAYNGPLGEAEHLEEYQFYFGEYLLSLNQDKNIDAINAFKLSCEKGYKDSCKKLSAMGRGYTREDINRFVTEGDARRKEELQKSAEIHAEFQDKLTKLRAEQEIRQQESNRELVGAIVKGANEISSSISGGLQTYNNSLQMKAYAEQEARRQQEERIRQAREEKERRAHEAREQEERQKADQAQIAQENTRLEREERRRQEAADRAREQQRVAQLEEERRREQQKRLEEERERNTCHNVTSSISVRSQLYTDYTYCKINYNTGFALAVEVTNNGTQRANVNVCAYNTAGGKLRCANETLVPGQSRAGWATDWVWCGPEAKSIKYSGRLATDPERCNEM